MIVPVAARRPSAADPLLILAMDHRESLGRTVFGVEHDAPTAGQRDAMVHAKQLIFAGLQLAGASLPAGRAGVLVDERYGQPAAVNGDTARYARDVRPELVTAVLADNQAAGVEPSIWKIEGLETPDAARAVVAQARAGGRDGVDAIVLGRDAPAERLYHWI